MANEARKIQMAQVKLQKSLTAFITVMGTDAKNHFVKSFRNQGFTDENLRRWKARKGEISGGIAKVSKKSKGSRAILVKSGDLRRSIRVVNKTINKVVLGSDLPYAQLHNDGGIVYRRAHKRTATRTIRIRGGYSGLGSEKGRGKKMQIMGERHNVSASSFKMPKRQFIGHSRKLIDQLRMKLDKRIQNVFR